ncbi:FAD-dependent oxidoreductase [Streptomyces sp. NPDC051214]|uniref:NAD(P)/FAD-dependent oxidoreductase n=1 Tax=Streptomyces sp. NPDC051214 TaxID=3155282 RepID=UPI003434F04B
MTPSADVVVVGNGVLGLSVAVAAARRDTTLEVAVIGPPARPLAASAAAGAMFNCFGEVTQYTSRHPAAEAKFTVGRQALAKWPEWLEMLAASAGLEADALRASHVPGTFVVLGARSGRIAARNFEAMQSALAQYDEPYEEVGPGAIDGLSPEPDARPFRALHLPREGAVDARRVLSALEAACRSHDVTLVPSTVTELVVANGRVQGVRLSDGTRVAAGSVVLAAGSTSTDLTADLLPPGAVPPLLHGTGLGLIVEPSERGAREVIRTPNRAATCGIHTVPLPASGQQYFGASNVLTSAPVAGPEFGAVKGMLQVVREQFDRRMDSWPIVRWLHGVRPITLDCFPLVGPCSIDGLIFATGTYRDGFHCSPVIAEHITNLLLDPATPAGPQFGWFTPERFPIETMTVEESVSETAVHSVDVAYENGLSMPWWMDDNWITDRECQTITRVYEDLEEPIAFAPEIILSLRDLAHPPQVKRMKAYLREARARHGTSTDPRTPSTS